VSSPPSLGPRASLSTTRGRRWLPAAIALSAALALPALWPGCKSDSIAESDASDVRDARKIDAPAECEFAGRTYASGTQTRIGCGIRCTCEESGIFFCPPKPCEEPACFLGEGESRVQLWRGSRPVPAGDGCNTCTCEYYYHGEDAVAPRDVNYRQVWVDARLLCTKLVCPDAGDAGGADAGDAGDGP
jgi:hypothetical protein